ncbi:threonine-phosphate decarboxylase CobD [Reyranella sp.]|uniref:threonine-phosphate decarboxylase CobD n=1 Tax=Reyranella sp. TaxID=1929291 RepID=UPI003D139CDB
MADVPIMTTAAEKPIEQGPLEHGGDLEALRHRYPEAPRPWIDLSTGINPVPYSVGDLPAEVWSRLPSRAAEGALLAAAARRYGVGGDAAIVAAPGTQALIQLLPRLRPRSKVAIVGRTYAEHEFCWRREGHAVCVATGLAATDGADVVVIVNPDNPTGRLVPADALRAVKAPLLVVDEAFIDLLPARASLAGGLPGNTVVLRSFGKTYGLAGVRLGFAIASPDLAERLRGALGPWAVSGPALEIGRRALADDSWLDATARRLAADGEKLDTLLRAAGCTVLGGTTLFRLAEHGEVLRVADALARHGIHIRTFTDRPTLLRFGLPANDEEFARLAGALQVPQNV